MRSSFGILPEMEQFAGGTMNGHLGTGCVALAAPEKTSAPRRPKEDVFPHSRQREPIQGVQEMVGF